jgi:hypothetical protein
MTEKTPAKKSEVRQRKHLIQVRLNDEEAQIFQERAAQSELNVADYVRVTCLQGKPLRKVRRRHPERLLLVQIETALNRIGGNVNQLAAKANSTGFLSREESLQLRTLIADAHKVVERLLPANDDDYQGH